MNLRYLVCRVMTELACRKFCPCKTLKTHPVMSDRMDEAPLPDYDNPPVIETVLGVQFERLPGLTNGHLGAFWKTLSASEWPTVSDAPSLEPQFERFEQSARWVRGLHIQLTQDPTSRLQVKNKAGDRMIQVQNGRLHFNWLGAVGGAYPRYEHVREGFDAALRSFLEFLTQEKVGEFRPNQWEVTYVNHIPKGSIWNTPNDWGFFRPLNSVPTIADVAAAESFGGEWHFVIPKQRGRLHVQWQHVLNSGPEQEQQDGIRLTFTARGPAEEHDDLVQSVLNGLDLGRKTIVGSFTSLMSNEANNYWGLKHVSD